MTDRKRKYYSQVVELLRIADVAIEVVDARFVEETRIKKLENRFGNKIIVVAAKADLISKEKRLPELIYFSSRTREGDKEILKKVVKIGRANPYRRTKEIKIVVFGVPNVGKSSLINTLKKKYAAKTGFKAGLTRGPQWIRLSDEIMLCDSAGIVDLNENEKSLALKNALDVTELKAPEQVAAELIAKAAALKPNPIFKYYNILETDDAEDVLNQIAKKRGLLGKGGKPLISEAARILLRDYQKGKFLI